MRTTLKRTRVTKPKSFNINQLPTKTINITTLTKTLSTTTNPASNSIYNLVSKLIPNLTIITVLSLSTIAIAITLHTNKAYALTPPDSCFNFNSGTNTIEDYYNNENNDSNQPACPKAVDIPSTIGGNAVTNIDGDAFNNKSLTSVTIPSSVTTIENGTPWNGAFANNSTLTSVTIPSSVTTIGDLAFYSSGLTTITIPSSVTTIGNSAFSFNQLTSVTIPSSVVSLGEGVFFRNQLTSVTIAGNPTTLGTDILQGNPITSISYNGTAYTDTGILSEQCFDFNSGTGTINKYLFADLNLIKNSSIACLDRSVDIPSTIGGTPVTIIGDVAFQFNQLTSITIPSSVTTIGNYAFTYNQLTSVTIPSSVTTIGDYAFFSNQLTSVTIPSSVTTIGVGAFVIQTKQGGPTFLDYGLSEGDPTVAQAFLDSILYTNIIIDPTQATTLGLSEGVFTEADIGENLNADGDQTDVVSGTLINASSVNITYKDSNGSDLAPLTTKVSDTLPSYLAIDNPTNDPNLYYHMGNSLTITPPDISGYITPSSQTIASMIGGENNINFVYQQDGGGSNSNNNVVTLPNAEDGELVEVRTPSGTNITCSNAYKESSLASQDSNYTYSLGLVDFCFDTTSSNNQVELTFVTNLQANQVKARKYNPNTKTYTDLPNSTNPTITQTTYNNKPALKLTYTIIDNSDIDLDPSTGKIKDPIGLALTSATANSLANTGSHHKWILILGGAIALTGLTIFKLSWSRRAKYIVPKF